ncbi:Cyclin-dependent kinase [Phytophthora cactorum]|uniref:Cyclin-dependent kinase 2 homolog n=1 Tax=Phytophthora cactorum TaxID=29920 RepID=A0A8T1DHW7_9STRA|nr:Cyclin-dependent kinase [Phytophthora cactorum]KAG2849559.1 Cyclin-dependent kinase [Phytophthora cactorum]KAG2857292.1 Cyclin-dependent kinase [Phytophthora cactorum]KAG2921727.1 Cyclin-dependent kinase [Phytophthora cactorum]KAG2925110.1 Cyclin-dependent kinase [Phytophthora cactorum]
MAKRNRWDSDSDSGDERVSRRKQKSSSHSNSSSTTATVSSSNVNSSAVSKRSTPDEIAVPVDPLRHNFYLWGCRSVDCYARIGKIDEGTYGVVSKARDKETGDIVALKQVKMSADVSQEGFPITALRETNVLLALDHPNIVQVREMVVGSTPDKIYMVMDYAENDLKHVMQTKMKAPWLQSEVKYLLHSLLSAVAYMHDRWYIHRDLKTSNLLYDARGVLKICDFGLARKYGSPLRTYTQLVVTLWYRSPELLLGAKDYSTAVDMWSVGCIFAEMLLMKPLFAGRGELDQTDQIFKLLGVPNEENWPGVDDDVPNASVSVRGSGCSLSKAGFDLLSRMLALSPRKRISAKEALAHEYFQESPPPKQQELMPTFPA